MKQRERVYNTAQSPGAGYTIVEMLIFLAVTGLMFVMAASFINGKQGRAEFNQSVNDLNSQIQQTIGDVSNGSYPSAGNFSCDTGTGSPVVSTVTTKDQGTNMGCIFLGKVIQFAIAGDDSSYAIYTVAGCQFKGCSSVSLTPPASFTDAKPTVANGVGLTQDEKVSWGFDITGAYDDSGTALGAIGFFSGLNNAGSGPQTVTPVIIPNSQLNQSKASGVANISSSTTAMDTAAASTPNPKVTLCLKGGDNQYGAIIIGGDDATSDNNARLSTAIKINTAKIGPCPA